MHTIATFVVLTSWLAAPASDETIEATPATAPVVEGVEIDGERLATPSDTASRITVAVGDALLRDLLVEALESNPGLRVSESALGVARHRADRVGGLPDPQVMVTAYVEPPETRVGPQRLMTSVSQPIPWNGKRTVAARAEIHRARAVEAELAATRLQVVTSVRTAYRELGYVAEQVGIAREFRRHLERHEEIARSRYGTGRGTGQGVLKLQAEITRVDRMVLDLEVRRATLEARLEEMIGRPAGDSLGALELPEVRPIEATLEELLAIALDGRPELEAIDGRIGGATDDAELARLRFRPDFMVGLTYALVEDRDDPAGRAMPPPDNGEDVFGVQAGISIPLWGDQRRAGLEEALERRRMHELTRVRTSAAIASELADLSARLEITWSQLRLLEDLLIVQAVEAVESAQAAYVAGSVNALDLFDAEHVLFEARTAIARTKADYLIAWARLEGAVAAPLAARETP